MGLDAAGLAAYRRALELPTVLRRFEFDVLDMDDQVVGQLDPNVVEGQLTFDASATPQTVCSLTIVDERGTVDFDAGVPAATGLHYTRQIRVSVSTFVAELDAWVTTTPFWGPVRAFDRSGESVTVTAHSRDAVGNGHLWTALSRKKGTRKTDIIAALLIRYGETRYSIPTLSARVPKAVNYGRDAQPWPAAQALARAMNRQLYYAGGRAILRPWPSRPTFNFNGLVLRPGVRQTRSGFDQVVNAVEVLGPKPKGHKTRIRATAVLTPAHSFSSLALGIGAGREYLTQRVENSHIRSVAQAQALANHLIDEHAREIVAIQFDSVPVYNLHLGDMASAAGHAFRLNSFSLPLSAGSGGDGPPMTVGYSVRTTRA